MARTVRNAKIDTPSGRAKLMVRREPHWTVISQGVALGYRKGGKGGFWVARLRDEAGKQHYEALGAADDARDANGDDVLSFAQAQGKARDWFERKRRELAAGDDDPLDDDTPIDDGPLTVATCLAVYLRWYAAHNKASGLASTRAATATHILPALGAIEVAKLTTPAIRRWHHDLASSPARLRSGLGKERRFRPPGDDPEAPRRRKSTANRVLTILKAALNKAFADRRVASDDAWRRVKPFRNVEAARVRYLSDDQCRRLVNACDPSFRPMLQAALFSGCRYGELTALRVDDFNPDAGTLLVRVAKSGHARHVVLTDEGRAFFAVQSIGKAGDARLFTRPDGAAWGKSHQQRPLVEGCERAAITPAASFHVLRHTYASRLAMRGVPLLVIAKQLGHGDTRMVEKHYGHLAASYVADTVRALSGTLGIGVGGAIVPLERRRG